MDSKVGKSASNENLTVKPIKPSKKLKKPKLKSKCTHPPIAKMVNKAIESLNARGGSSVQAIKKYVAANYIVDSEKVAPFIKKYLAKAVDGNILSRTTGKGFSGSFKLVVSSGKKPETATTRHVTGSGTTKLSSKSPKGGAKKKTTKTKTTNSKQKIQEGAGKSVEKKVSKASFGSTKSDKIAT